MQTSGPFNLTLGQSLDIPVPPVQGVGQKFTAVILTNISPFVCQIYVGGASYSKWLAPGAEELVPITDTVNDINVTPQVATTPIGTGTSATILATWVDAQSPALSDSWPNSSALGAVTAFQQGEVALIPSPLLFGGTGAQTFTAPANSPTFTDVMIGYIVGSGGTPNPIVISAKGSASGLVYLAPVTMVLGQFVTVPFNSVIDPLGLTVSVSFPGSVGLGAMIAVVGLVYPTTVRPYFGVANQQGPTNYVVSTAAAGTATMLAAGSASQVVRVWSLWLNTKAADASVTYSTSFLMTSSVGANTAQNTTSASFPGGVPVNVGANAIILNATGTAGAGLAYSIDIP